MKGYACFVCETDKVLEDIGGKKSLECPRCSPSVILDLSQGQRVLEHIGTHILYDPGVIRAKDILCGLCPRPSPLCQFFLTKGKGTNGNLRVNSEVSRGCLEKINYSYRIAAESTTSSPCSNVPIQCPVCAKSEPAIWKYFMKAHFTEKHKNLHPFTKYEHLWQVSDFELSEMKMIWEKRSKVTVKRTKKSNVPLLLISDAHRARIPSRYQILMVLYLRRMTYHAMNSNCDEDGNLPEANYEQVHNDEPPPSSSPSLEPSVNSNLEKEIQDIYIDDVENSELANEVEEQEDGEMSVVVDVEKEGSRSQAVDAIQPIMVRNPKDIAEEPVLDIREPSADDSVSFFTVKREILNDSCQNYIPEFQNDTISLPTKRTRTRRAVELNGCFCGDVLNSSMPGVIECKRTGCETQWVSRLFYCLSFILCFLS